VDGGGGPDGGATDGGGTPDGGSPPGGSACPALQVQAAQSVGGFVSDVFTWRDGACQPRSAALVRNDRADPSGHRGGYLRRHTYRLPDGSTRTSDGASTRHPGFGYLVAHHENTATLSYDTPGTWRTALAGRHHALHEFRWTLSMGGRRVDATVHWLFATGRDHPVWAVTYDTSTLAPGALEADTRSPYGDLLFDGNADDEVAGVGWGDTHRFVSLASPVTLASGWDYTQPNEVPYVRMWTRTVDAEMGAVQTQTFAQKPAGGYWFYPSRGTRDADGPMPQDWNWTYQLNQYELPFTTRSHRLAWGSNFGAVGSDAYNAYGDDRQLDGHPFQSYAVHVVLGRHSAGPVLAQVAQVEALQRTRLTATVGQVLTEGPAGVGRTDRAPYAPAGHNPVYGTLEVLAAGGGRAEVVLEAQGPALQRPVLVVRGYTASTLPARLELDGQALAPDVDAYLTLDDAGDALWVTLARTLSGRHTLRLE
jgi:hypothetical protein